ncbi:hypothetical protein [Niveibacterium umoris]|uniref:O-antigen ligase domain-containing protein n=1 Tax=Niveibacterium umoris TaxID=1193620 RepID=A0A840BJ32_9RHOO|nr:hypothetical protein [Niveibacterium umoris]MBB4011602.1 hypothetical protein [Niveibacterium umoris]
MLVSDTLSMHKGVQKEEAGGLLSQLTRFAFVVVWLLITIDGLWTYSMVKLVGRRAVPITILMWTVIAFALFCSYLQRRRSLDMDPLIVGLLWAFLCYLLGASAYHADSGGVSFFGVWFSFFLYYFYLFSEPFMRSLRPTRNSAVVAFVLVALGVVMAIIGTAQHLLHDQFDFGRTIAVESGAFNLGFGGNIRANAFFAHSEDLGFFLSIGAALTVAWTQGGGVARRILALPIMLVLAIGCYSTLTRSAYLCFASASFASFLLVRARENKRAHLVAAIPILFLGCGVLLFFSRAIIEHLFASSSVVFSSSSIEDRIYGISYYANILSGEGLFAWLFGLGWHFNGAPRAYVPIDNGFFAVVLNSGFVGLVFWLAITWMYWRRVLHRALSSSSVLQAGVAAIYSTWLLLSLFGYIQIYQLMLILGAAFYVGIPDGERIAKN